MRPELRPDATTLPVLWDQRFGLRSELRLRTGGPASDGRSSGLQPARLPPQLVHIPSHVNCFDGVPFVSVPGCATFTARVGEVEEENRQE